MFEGDNDKMKEFLMKLLKSASINDLEKLTSNSSLKDEGYERTMTASNVLFMLNYAIKVDGLGKVLESVRDSIEGFEDGCDLPDKESIMTNWHAMLKCVERLIGSDEDMKLL